MWAVTSCTSETVRKENPPKQGLKHWTDLDFARFDYGPKRKSTKTRIESRMVRLRVSVIFKFQNNILQKGKFKK